MFKLREYLDVLLIFREFLCDIFISLFSIGYRIFLFANYSMEYTRIQLLLDAYRNPYFRSTPLSRFRKFIRVIHITHNTIADFKVFRSCIGCYISIIHLDTIFSRILLMAIALFISNYVVNLNVCKCIHTHTEEVM